MLGLENAISFITLCGTYSPIYDYLGSILIEARGTYGEPVATSK